MGIYLKVYDGKRKSQTRIGVTPTVIGRSSRCDVNVKDEVCSGVHCHFYIRNGRVIVKDLGSSNGTYVNGSKIDEAYIFIDDVVSIGNTKVIIDVGQLSPKEYEDHLSPDLRRRSKLMDVTLTDRDTRNEKPKSEPRNISQIIGISQHDLKVEKLKHELIKPNAETKKTPQEQLMMKVKKAEENLKEEEKDDKSTFVTKALSRIFKKK